MCMHAFWAATFHERKFSDLHLVGYEVDIRLSSACSGLLLQSTKVEIPEDSIDPGG